MIDFKEVHDKKMREGITVIASVIFVTLGVIFVLIGFFAYNAIFFVTGGLFIIIGVYLFIKLFKKSSEFHNYFLNDEAIPYLKSIIDNFKYDKDKGFSEDSLTTTNITNKYNYFESSSLISGTYKGIEFNYSDVSVVNVTKTKKDKFLVDQHFKGKIFKNEYPKPFKFTLLITKVSLLPHDSNLLKVSLGSITLPDDYNIYTNSKDKLLKVIPKELIAYLETIFNKDSNKCLVITGKTLAVLSHDRVKLFDVHNEQGYNEGLLKTFTDPLNIFVDIYNLVNPKWPNKKPSEYHLAFLFL